MIAEKLPDWLLSYTEKISELGAFAGKSANHVLVNEYRPEEGIMVHHTLTFSFFILYLRVPLSLLLLRKCNYFHILKAKDT